MQYRFECIRIRQPCSVGIEKQHSESASKTNLTACPCTNQSYAVLTYPSKSGSFARNIRKALNTVASRQATNILTAKYLISTSYLIKLSNQTPSRCLLPSLYICMNRNESNTFEIYERKKGPSRANRSEGASSNHIFDLGI